MAENENSGGSYTELIRGIIIIVLSAIGIIFGVLALWTLRSFLLIAFTCWVLSIALTVPINRLQRAGLERGPAIAITLSGALLLLLLTITVVLPPIVGEVFNLTDNLPEAAEQTIEAYEDFYQDNETLQPILPEITLEDYNETFDDSNDDEDNLRSELDLAGIATSAIPIIGGLGSLIGNIFANLFIIIVITVYLVLDPTIYYRGIVALVPSHREQRTIEILNIIRQTVIAWLGALSVSVTFTAVSVTIALGLILNIPDPIALGVLAGLGSFIPYVGFYLALLPVLVVTAADDPTKLIPALIIYVILGEIESKLVTPTVVKNELNVPAGLVLLFQLIAAAYLGFFGVLLAVPILAILVTLIRELYVYDRLHKRDKVPQVTQSLTGNLSIVYDVSEPPPET